MGNLVRWIEEEIAETGETVESVVIGKMGWGDFGSNGVPKYDEMPKGVVVGWDRVRSMLDYDFDEGYGAPGCNAVYVWTTKRVLFVTQYDGATTMYSVPRNPTDIMPEMPGG